MRYERVKIKRDDWTTYNRPVLPWEIAILEFTFGEAMSSGREFLWTTPRSTRMQRTSSIVSSTPTDQTRKAGFRMSLRCTVRLRPVSITYDG